ncbi:DedA family protein [Micromonospora krabiensis]|uniref:Membrane protein DedA, SNARE-associated domain n=1 Tax=Micromonospora krabiensis TaxID=307121 RepID=A0A1C3NBI2_9ACTN|nr:DedA family protein [Micromonospora krabiensis]SBV29921.1 membrane protein DedA, SNARE-associated domain [Micromonospora krabiensis]
MTFLDSLTDRLVGLPPAVVLLVAALVLAGEVGLLAGLVLPAATTMLTVGLLARTGEVDLSAALVVTTLAAFTGDQLGYLEGRLLGPRVRAARLGRRIGPDRWQRAEALVATRGGPAVLVGRWTAFVRTLVPRVAGAVGLPYRRFVLFDGIGVVVWVPGTVLVGYLAGGVPTGPLAAAGAVLAVAVGGVLLAHRLRARRRVRATRSCTGPARRGRAPAGPGPRPRRPGPGRGVRSRRGVLDSPEHWR